MKLQPLALFAIAVPTIASGYGLSRMLRRPLVVYSPMRDLIRQTDAMLDRAFDDFGTEEFRGYSPKYEITDTDEQFQIVVDVPQMKASDINVTLEHDNTVLSLAGELAEQGENYSFSTKFYQSFTLDPAVEVDKLKANLKDGLLTVSAPKDQKKLAAVMQNIPIMEKKAEETKEEEIPIVAK